MLIVGEAFSLHHKAGQSAIRSQTELSRYPRCIDPHKLFLVQQHGCSGIMSWFGENTDRAEPLLSGDGKACPSAAIVRGLKKYAFVRRVSTRSPYPTTSHITLLFVCYFCFGIPSPTQPSILFSQHICRLLVDSLYPKFS